jgi:hypothetical protein
VVDYLGYVEDVARRLERAFPGRYVAERATMAGHIAAMHDRFAQVWRDVN